MLPDRERSAGQSIWCSAMLYSAFDPLWTCDHMFGKLGFEVASTYCATAAVGHVYRCKHSLYRQHAVVGCVDKGGHALWGGQVA